MLNYNDKNHKRVWKGKKKKEEDSIRKKIEVQMK